MLGNKPEPVLRCDPARNIISTPFIQAEVLQIQRKIRKGKFLDASNEKQLRLTVSTSNFVSLMGYKGVVGTVADKVKVWVPRGTALPTAISRSQTLTSQGSSSKRKGGNGKGGNEEGMRRERAGHGSTTRRTVVGPSTSGNVVEISSPSEEDPRDSPAKKWLGFLDLTTPEPEHTQSRQKLGESEVVDLTMEE